MKKSLYLSIVLLFATSISFSQANRLKYNLDYNNLKGNIVKTVEKTYYLNEKSNEFVYNRSYTLHYNSDGNLTKTIYNHINNPDDETEILEYIYNDKNQLVQDKNVSVIKRDGYSNNFFTFNDNNKLVKTENHTAKGLDNYQVFKYNDKNRVESVSRYFSNDKIFSLLSIKEEANKTSEMMFRYDNNGLVHVDRIYNYDDNLLSDLEYKGIQFPYKRIFTYDDNRNEQNEIDNKTGVVLKEYVYKYDNTKNWIVKFTKTLQSKSIVFREITYANGTTSGSSAIDETYASQFKNYELSGKNSLINEDNSLTKNTWKFYFYKDDQDKLIYYPGTVTFAMRDNKNLRVGNMADLTWNYGTTDKIYETKDLKVVNTGLDGNNRVWVLENSFQRIYLVSFADAIDTRGSIGNLMIFMGKKSDNKMFGYYLEHQKNNY